MEEQGIRRENVRVESCVAMIALASEHDPFTRTGWYTPFSPKSKVSGGAYKGKRPARRVADIFASRDSLNGESGSGRRRRFALADKLRIQ